MEPLDALVLQKINKNTSGNWAPNGRDVIKAVLNVSQDEVLVSFEHLAKLECLLWQGSGPRINPTTTSLGRLLMRVVQD